jgi:CO/xanthine dehydrogenase Mo-binding subunit
MGRRRALASLEVAAACGEAPGLEASHVLAPSGEVWSGGAVVAAVRIERDTGVFTLERLVWIDDAGTIVNSPARRRSARRLAARRRGARSRSSRCASSR